MVSKDHIEITYAQITQPFSRELYEYYLTLLPEHLQEKNQHYVRWQDRHLNLVGKLMLRAASIDFGSGSDALQGLKYNEWGKPFLEHLNFSISHSGDFVVCASTRLATNLGIDIEHKRPVSFHDFHNTMNAKQWADINRNPLNALNRFYSYWVRKESVIKAVGRGLAMSLADINFSESNAWIEGDSQTWYIQEVSLYPEYAMALASETKLSSDVIRLREFRVEH